MYLTHHGRSSTTARWALASATAAVACLIAMTGCSESSEAHSPSVADAPLTGSLQTWIGLVCTGGRATVEHSFAMHGEIQGGVCLQGPSNTDNSQAVLYGVFESVESRDVVLTAVHPAYAALGLDADRSAVAFYVMSPAHGNQLLEPLEKFGFQIHAQTSPSTSFAQAPPATRSAPNELPSRTTSRPSAPSAPSPAPPHVTSTVIPPAQIVPGNIPVGTTDLGDLNSAEIGSCMSQGQNFVLPQPCGGGSMFTHFFRVSNRVVNPNDCAINGDRWVQASDTGLVLCLRPIK